MNDTIKAIEVSFYDKENSLQLATDIYTAHVKPLEDALAKAEEREKCIERWNALPRALVWTTEPPKVEGFYWARRKNTNTLHVVRVMEIREELSVFMPGSEIDGYLHWYTLWAGPIPEPQEPRT